MDCVAVEGQEGTEQALGVALGRLRCLISGSRARFFGPAADRVPGYECDGDKQ